MIINLNKPILKGKKSLEQSIFERISIRSFINKDLELEKISQILWAAQGRNISKRTVRSAGAIYPLEIYVILKNKGLYYYDFQKGILRLDSDEKEAEKILKQLTEYAWGQYFIYEAPMNIIICVDYPKIEQGYGKRGKRYALIEVGHCAQNIHLEAVALDLGSVPIGAFQDNSIKILLKLPEHIDPIYIIPVGYPK